jgi:uncharacterized damage-inducible protein DinB
VRNVRAPKTVREDLLELSHDTFDRTRDRLADLTDDEYRWSPVAGAWTVRTLSTGRTVVDGNHWPPKPAPFTTLAWRLTHLVDVYGSDRNGRWLAVDAGTPVNAGVWRAAPDAAGALALLDDAGAYWHGLLEAATDDHLADVIGPQGGPYAAHTRRSLVLHQLDEAIHHAAEIAVLRDLHRVSGPSAAVVDEVTVASLRDDPLAVTRAADLGRWDLVVELVEAGADVHAPGRTALHQAAAYGDVELVRLLVERGAALDAVDPDFRATPLGWAQAFFRRGVIEYLEGR